MARNKRWGGLAIVGALVAALAATVPVGLAEAGPAACEKRTNDTVEKMLECVTLAGVREHQQAFQQIADRSGGNRFSGLPGHDRSVEYVEGRLRAAGYTTTRQAFDYFAFAIVGSSALQQVAPNAVTYVENVDFGVIDQSDPGDESAPVTAVDLQLGLGNTSTSGCEESDFAGFPDGNIALLQRGTCTFEIKAENAAAPTTS
jgi:hypothetical protein